MIFARNRKRSYHLTTLLVLLTAAMLIIGCEKEKPQSQSQSQSSQGEGLQWMSYQKGIELGKKEKKNVLVSFEADWCVYCKKMEGETFANKDVAQYLQDNYVIIRVDADREKELATEYRVDGLPVNWFIDEEGEKIAYLPGFIPPEMFLPILKYVVTDAYKNMSLEEYLKKAISEV